MKNNKIKQPIPSEVANDVLDKVSGGITNSNSHEEFLPSAPLLQEDDVSVEPIPDATPSIP